MVFISSGLKSSLSQITLSYFFHLTLSVTAYSVSKFIQYGGSVNTISAFSPFISLFTSSIFVESQHNSLCSPISNRSHSTISVLIPSSTSKSSSSASGSTVSNCTSSHHSSSSSLSHSFAKMSQSHSQLLILSRIIISLSSSSVSHSIICTGTSFIPRFLHTSYR